MRCSIIVPCYNERYGIKSLIDAIICDFPDECLEEIIIVDDNSPDGTALFVKETFKNFSKIKTIIRYQKRGLAFSIREGIENSSGDVVLVMDSDFNHDPKYCYTLYTILKSPLVDIVVGSRFLFGGASTNSCRYFLSKTYNLFINIFIGSKMTDNLTGFFAIKREKFFSLDFDAIFWGYGDYYFRLLKKTQDMRYYHVQIPIQYGERKNGDSKTYFFSIFLKYTREVILLAFKRIYK